MSNCENKIPDNVVTSIKLESYDDLCKCFKKNIHLFRSDMAGTIKSINPDNFFESGNILRELQTRVELLLKLYDFIDYVGVLQDSLIKEN